MAFFELQNITFAYPTNLNEVILDNFSLSLEKGEIMGILGRSGSGKSTLLRIIAGLETPLSGSIIIDGKVMLDAHVCKEPEKRGVGMVFQDYVLFPHLTVAQNIAFGLHRLPKKVRAERMEFLLDLVELKVFRNRYPHELSGGQQQRVAVARALAPNPDLLLMDEPFSNLDADLKGKIRNELKRLLKKANMTCIFVTHDKDDVIAICDRAIKMEEQGAQ